LIAHQCPVRLDLAEQDPCRRLADIRAVMVQADAARKAAHVLLGKAGIGAYDTGIGA